jgi:hypothetical protein
MSNRQPLEFVTRHFSDLLSIRFAPVPVAMILAAVAHPVSSVGRIGAWSILLSFLVAAAGFYWWSTAAIRRRYGSVQTIRPESWRMQRHLVVVMLRVALALAAVWWYFSPRTSSWSDIYIAFTVLLFMLIKILDSTNLASRRIVWGLGLVTLFGAGPFVARIDHGAPVFLLAGSIWFTLSAFDFMLLRRILGRTYSPPFGDTVAPSV